MSVVTPERFAGALSWSEFLAGSTKELETRANGFAAVELTPTQRERLERLKAAGLAKVLVIEEDWCGDAARSGPVVARMAQEAGLEARWFRRDSNLDLMDQYLENGKSRAIPAIVFMDATLGYITHWGSRPAHVKAAKEQFGPLPAKDDPAWPEAFARFRTVLFGAYAQDYPNAIVEEFLSHLEMALLK
ncbi:MAG TPA: thioredoxin family protein [Symbiobacteriaceae bacterium]|nr:thioredoxin family protein [Symbiobacteriaceae bacterium]